jgi:hypothetical protein
MERIKMEQRTCGDVDVELEEDSSITTEVSTEVDSRRTESEPSPILSTTSVSRSLKTCEAVEGEVRDEKVNIVNEGVVTTPTATTSVPMELVEVEAIREPLVTAVAVVADRGDDSDSEAETVKPGNKIISTLYLTLMVG